MTWLGGRAGTMKTQLRLGDQLRTHLLFIVCYLCVLLHVCDSNVTVRMFLALSLESKNTAFITQTCIIEPYY